MQSRKHHLTRRLPFIGSTRAVGDGQKLTTSLGAQLDTVQFALENVTGLDHHDSLIEPAQQVAVSVERHGERGSARLVGSGRWRGAPKV